jgi:ABC-type nickel/cobalt efflux system permease component RcnA
MSAFLIGNCVEQYADGERQSAFRAFAQEWPSLIAACIGIVGIVLGMLVRFS